MADAVEVLVLGECSEGGLTSTTGEIIAAGRELAEELGTTVACGLVGHGLEQAAQAAVSWGADRVCVVDDPRLWRFQVELTLQALTGLCRAVTPRILLMARTPLGRDVAPRLAARLGVPLAQDCLEVKIDATSKNLLVTRPVYGGNAMARIVSTGSPQFATVRPKVYKPLAEDADHRGEVMPIQVALDPSAVKTTVVDVIKEETEGIKLEDAKIVVAGGRGLGGPEGFRPLQELAKALGAGIGASRAAVDSGWVPYSWQIGLTGKTITPDVYITVGISGASQHIAGCSGAKCIVAINKDRDANIFRYARYGIVADWQKLLDAIIHAARALDTNADAEKISAP
ncbi:MAG TPA: electron transfer flavoprotein subunit alpha/FixB family protein [Candidatus Tectomicrobia bacterium]|nr:electron transfer flavoprotein subunit alpha/FixB family protein [Candidatus Tectomicrobia bacterium]